MSGSNNVASATSGWNVLVIDTDPNLIEMVQKYAIALSHEKVQTGDNGGSTQVRIRTAATMLAADVELQRKAPDVLLVNLQMEDQAGIDWIRRLKQRHPGTEVIGVSRTRRSELCLEVWRAGATDLLWSPVQPQDLERAFTGVNSRRAATSRLTQRNRRLRVACRRLNKARHEISQQVDLLCNDLVRSYQEMAQQLNVTQSATEYAQAVAGEPGVEGILRRTMEWVLHKVGPVNAAIYLPNGDDHFALGAYLNLDTQADAPLIEALGKTIVNQARSAVPLIIEDDAMLEQLYGDDARQLTGRQWLAVGCRTRRECLAVLAVFRTKPSSEKPETGLSESTSSLLEAVAPILAERIEQALGLYHRLNRHDHETEE